MSSEFKRAFPLESATVTQLGLTVLDYFAGVALASRFEDQYKGFSQPTSYSDDDHARRAYRLADAMVKERDRRMGNQ
jgi:hypothetical protein